jgi:DNA-binding NtrC family response regulator
LVICDHRLPDGGWKSVLAALDSMEDRPVLIVSSRLADERLWAEVLNLGAFDLLLGSPFVPEEVLRVTESATLTRSPVGDAENATRSSPDVCRGSKDNLTIAGTAGGGA